MSYQVTQARAVAQACDRAWRAHRHTCATCSLAAQGRKWDRLCREGRALWDDRGRTARELAEERRLDAEPAPGQETMF